ncbi:MAG: sigma-70 family RNA polymerase sigma factor [Lachnoclostridium sp.]|nr:sigma-70 family RNA polymerase sigma factor [Lachnospira sp.]MCM1249498.1 sigma-70 family RNA polymerase sigma factor [Lachnoclostridium sp.]MCM1536559.1 sigma-70 family RNA polymerase sigma factor [Clostridium sp.]
MNDKETVLAIKNGDEAAIAGVIQKYSKLLWSIAGAILINASSEQEIEECVADVFIYLWQNPDKYDAGKGKLSSWLSVIARTKAIDRYRKITAKREVAMEDNNIAQGFDMLAELVKRDDRKLLFSCLERLEETEREIIERRYFYGQKPKEIAVAVNLSVKQVENRLYHAKQKLCKFMNEKG